MLGLVLMLCFCDCVYGAVISAEQYYKLDIIHYNDFHARFEETSLASPICRTNDASCLGGFPRLYHHIMQLKQEKPDALVLNAGDSFQGTYWYTLLKWNVTQHFMNMLPHDAHAVGNHEFDDGPEGLVPYFKALKAPVLAANMDTANEPKFQGTYKPSLVIERKGKKIGIIGLITTDTKFLSNAGNVVFTDPGEATRREALALTEQGVDIIILLSHCGLDVDKQLARDHGQYIDVIVGGHTHSLLWNGPSPSGDEVVGPYPVIIETAHDKKHKVLIVQASSYSKFMGNLSVYFNNNGDYVLWEGGPIFLNRSIEEDIHIKKLLEPYAKVVHEAENTPVAESLVDLNSQDCGNGECGLGDLMTDSMVEYAKNQLNSSINYIGFIQRSNLRSKVNKGTITKGTLFDLLPFNDRIEHFQMKGQHVKEVLERSVSNITCFEPFNAPWMSQVSGLQVIYNVSLPKDHRVTSVFIGATDKSALNNDVYYDVVAPSFWSFGPEYADFSKYKKNVEVIGHDTKILETYLTKHAPLNVQNDGRIVINK